MYDLKIFENEEYGQISVIVEDSKVYFESTKVAKSLGYANPHKAIKNHCEKEGLTIRSVEVVTGKKLDGSNAKQRVNKKFMDEGNLYRLILKSKLSSAKKFEAWVVEEVLPAIGKHGVYIEEKLVDEILNNQNFLIKLVANLKYEKEKVQILNKTIKDYEPYIKIGKLVGECEDCISIGAFAKLLNTLGINIGRNRLFNWFRNNGYLMSQGIENHPKQKYIEQGLFRTRQFIINTNHGSEIKITTYITGKGQKYFIDLIKGDFEYENTYKYN
ncbi:phage antirepressor KilAC domain-containing protein [Clostridium sp. CCUG 7971]|uniref:phage antirepressor KilAC domain-containing protein n=1 Tax=Clostridium sp. CCUG 7971 TaxID=2811414 RepID=UPI001ABA9BC3|nr:phage antirepressor KilAC domain-containing protein [Clostridium sp. CCUG 7971]MBO3443698.1 phage antirepressor KilAC domain-containing protein [Clostridium sp. CCUG 7971]